MVKRNNIAGFLDITQEVLSVWTHVFHSITFPAVVADVLLKDWWTLNRKGSKPQHRNEQPPLFILFFGSIVRNMFEVFALQNFYPLRPFPWPWHRLHVTTYRNQINHPFGLQSIARLCTWIWHSMLDVFPVSIESDMLFTCKCMQFQQHEVVFTPLQFQLSCANCTFYHPTVAVVTKVTSKWQAFNLSINLPSISVNAMVVAPSFFIWSSGQDTSPCIWHAIFMKNMWHERLETVLSSVCKWSRYATVRLGAANTDKEVSDSFLATRVWNHFATFHHPCTFLFTRTSLNQWHSGNGDLPLFPGMSLCFAQGLHHVDVALLPFP